MRIFRKPQATRRPPEPPEAWWETALAAVAMLLVIAGMVAVLVMLESAWAEPEERCFTTAFGETYCRTQSDWGDA